MSNYETPKMNKAVNKESKARKCPSKTINESEVSEVKDSIPKICKLNQDVHEKNDLKNGFVNGVDSESTVVHKSNRKNRRNRKTNNLNATSLKEHIHSDINCRPEENCIAKTPKQTADQSRRKVETNSITQSDNIVNNVDTKLKETKKKKCKTDSLDSNDNISHKCCDNVIADNQKSVVEANIVQNVEDISLLPCKIDKDISIEKDCVNNITDQFMMQIEESLKNVQLNCSEPLSDVEKPSEELTIVSEVQPKIDFIQYESELQMPMIMKIIQKDLSEPYSIYTYRYFIHNWPKLCFLAMCEGECVGAIVCKLDLHRKVIRRGYIAMLAVDRKYRKLRIGSKLVQMAINEMIVGDADEVVLETEVTNKPALQLYEKLGFVRDKRLFRYYLNGVDALRLKLWLR